MFDLRPASLSGLLRWLLVPVAAALLSGCGFYLAGSRPLPLPLQSVFIDVIDPYSVSEPALETSLQRIIQSRGGQVRSKIEESSSLLRLSKLTETRETVAIGPNGKATQYRLVTRVHYELLGGPHTLVPEGILTVAREYSFSAEQILAKQQEESRLRTYSQDEIAELLMLRLEASLRNPAASPPAAASSVAG